ncbi:MAG: YaiI/YqxD family protein [Rhodocyclales bacterium]|nr:YaiI/YqxD family protein [Rhodocyclales bacterium]
MRIWVDADACPIAIKEVLYRAANRAKVSVILIANQMLRVPPSPWIRALQVPAGFDVADQRIVQEATQGDLVITSDIPLASQVIAKGALVLDSRGELMDQGNIEGRLTMRNFMEGLRNSGVDTGGPSGLSKSDVQAFANQLDRLLAKRRLSNL